MKPFRDRVPSDIQPMDIFTFYFIAYLMQTRGHEIEFRDFGMFVRELEAIKRKYLNTFSDVIENQLVKYINRGRHDKDSEGRPLFDLDRIARRPMADRLAELRSAMNTTYRSDMQRRNVVWNALAEHVENLAKAKKPESLIYYIDRVNNQVHNVPETVLYKIENGHELARAFDIAHQAQDPTDYINEVKPSIVNAAKALSSGQTPLQASRRRLFGRRGRYADPYPGQQEGIVGAMIGGKLKFFPAGIVPVPTRTIST